MARKTRRAPPVVADPHRLNLGFYQGFDCDYHLNKTNALMCVLENLPQLKKKLFEKNEPQKEIDKFAQTLRAEIYFTECHLAEVTFALLIAAFQKKPHWLFLTEYDMGQVRRAIGSYLERDAHTLTGGRCNSIPEFLDAAVYTGLRPADLAKSARWKESLGNLDWLLRRAGKRYISADEYNAYKHGLRVRTGHTRLAIYPDGQPEKATTIASSPDSLTFLQVRTDSEGARRAFLRTKHFSHLESFNHIIALWKVLKTIRESRLARLDGKPGGAIETFLTVDRNKIERLSKSAEFEISV